MKSLQQILLLTSFVTLAGCSAATDGPALPYATSVRKFTPGEGAGFGQDYLPDVVLGPPDGAQAPGPAAKPNAILSLGAGGDIELAFDGEIADGPGPDFVVFENPFWVRNDPTNVWAELGEVSVSEDGKTWHTFTCAAEPDQPGQWPGCAGWTPTKHYDPDTLVPLDPSKTGGDAFDLADLGVEKARYVRIHDMLDKTNSTANNVGFDLDAVGVVHWAR